MFMYPGGKVHEAYMEPIWDRQDPGGPHVGPMKLTIWVCTSMTSHIEDHCNVYYYGIERKYADQEYIMIHWIN